jgi:1-deoxy-D-xylulose-5-phosphate reductoisomerase
VLNAANEAAVEAFLEGRIGFGEIVPLVEMVLNISGPAAEVTLEDLLAADEWARRQVDETISAAGGKQRAGERGPT